MPREPENTCECGEWKSEDYDECRECGQVAKDEREEAVAVKYHARINETAKAVQFKLERGFTGKSAWVPKSQLLDEDTSAHTFAVPRWWAEQEGIEHEG